MSQRARRLLSAFGMVVTVTLLTASCLPGGAEEEGPDVSAEGTEEAAEWTGTITMFAQAYTPNAEVANAQDLSALQDAADRYAEQHPGITIEFIDERFDVYNDQVRALAAAGDLWDVFWAQWASLNGSLPEGIAVDLAPAFEEPNPYAPDAASWAEAMNTQVIETTRAGSGASYNINGDYVTTGWYYNADLFEQAGVKPPETWGQFVEACQRLRDAGITPVAFVPYYGHMQRHFLADFYSEDYESIAELDGQPAFSAADEALAIDQGILSPADPRFMGWWEDFKRATDLWQPDYITAPSERNDRAKQDFIAGNAAMYYSGSQTCAELETAGVGFEFDVFPFPQLTPEESEFATGAETDNAVGGPTGAYQYAMSTPQANETMQEPGKPEAVLDWMRFIGSPEVAGEVVNEAGQFIPTFAGVEPLEQFRQDAELVEQPWRSIYVGQTAPNLDVDLQRIFGSFLGGNITMDEARAELQPLLEEAATEFIEENDLG